MIAKLQEVGPVAIHNWAYKFRFAKLLTRLVRVPHPISGRMTFQYLMWVIHSRDTWMHRLDICRATGRPFKQTPEHDGRIAALVMRDMGEKLAPRLGGRAMVFELSGPAGGLFQVGRGEQAARLRMDTLDFNIFVSGRFTYEQAMERAEISGERELAEKLLRGLVILY